MFDEGLPEPDQVQSADDHTLAAAVAGWARVEAAAAARRLAVIAELTARRISDAGVCSRWACDGWDAAAAEIAAAAGLTRGRASNQMYLALALRNRLPKVAALFADGVLSAPIVATIAWHTTLVENPHALAVIDTTLAFDALHYGQLSLAKTVAAIHAVIAEHDPDALRRTRTAARDRDLTVALNDTEEGTTGLWGRLYAHDAAALDRRLAAMAHGVCDDDPRTIAQRRADALGALAAGNQQLVCACDNPHCPAKTGDRPNPGALIYVLADAATTEAPADTHQHGEKPQTRPWVPGMPLIQDRDPEPDRPAVTAPPAQILGGPLIPAAMLAELIRAGATVRPLWIPAADTEAEPHYRPSARLAAFIRCRDITCRFPGVRHEALLSMSEVQ